MKDVCRYYQTCPIITGKMALDGIILNNYKRIHCHVPDEGWGNCKRYQVRDIVGKCPLDILPDSPMSAEEIIEKYDL